MTNGKKNIWGNLLNILITIILFKCAVELSITGRRIPRRFNNREKNKFL